MNKKKLATLFGTMIIAGQVAFVSAAGDPGSSSDPVVTASYVQAKINAINTTVDTSALESKISKLESRLTTAESKLTTAESKLTTAESKLTSTETKLKSVESKLATAESKIASLESAINELKNSNNGSSNNGSSSTSSVSNKDLNLLYHLNNINIDKKYGATSKSNVAIKESASASSKTLATLPYYAGINLIEAKDGWIKVSYYNTVGWVKYNEVLPIMR